MIDKVEILVKGGDGGDGAVSFRREKFVSMGGPDGGDGGSGGKVFVVADDHVENLKRYKWKRLWTAPKGQNGTGQKRHGKDGDDLWITVPLGTTVSRYEEQVTEPVADLLKTGERVQVARGGRGGWGNSHFATPTSQVPRTANPGEPGEEVTLLMILRMMCDIAIIGCPNVGKSALLTAISAAHPKVADYPFTTTDPMRGSIEVGFRRYVVVDMPALVAGASQGQGLGNDSLKHAERARVLLHLVDGLSASPAEDVAAVNQELALFQPALAEKPQLLVVNKLDLPEVRARRTTLKQELGRLGALLLFISAATGEGVPELVARAVEMVEKAPSRAQPAEESPMKVFRPRPVDRARG